MLARSTHEMHLAEESHIVLHQQIVQEHIDLRLQESYEVLRLDEFGIQIILPLDSDLLPKLLDLIESNRID